MTVPERNAKREEQDKHPNGTLNVIVEHHTKLLDGTVQHPSKQANKQIVRPRKELSPMAAAGKAIRALGGKMSIESAGSNKGITIWVRFPTKRQNVEPVKHVEQNEKVTVLPSLRDYEAF
jgi:redox-sensitive bicupin YhaK (pirin superfamily)